MHPSTKLVPAVVASLGLCLCDAAGTLSVTVENGCTIRLQAAQVPGATQYRWSAMRNGCLVYESSVLGTSTVNSVSISSRLPYAECWFRVDALSASGQVLQSEYSVDPAPPVGGGPSMPESPYRAGAPEIQMLGFESVWLDPASGQGPPAQFWVESTNAAPTTYQWYRDSVPIAGATSSSLMLPVGFGDDGARISVSASNACGTVTSPERTVVVTPRPHGAGISWIGVTELSTRNSTTWCCMPYTAFRTVTTWSTRSAGAVPGITLSPTGATMSNSQSGGGGRFTNLRRLTFAVEDWVRFTYGISSSASSPALNSASLEGAGITFPVSTWNTGAVSVTLPPGTYTISSTSAAGTTCCGGNYCHESINLSASWYISCTMVPLCTVNPSHPSCCPADIDVSRIVDGHDLGILLSAWGPCGSQCTADLNRDGYVDGADLGRLLNDWGSCR